MAFSNVLIVLVSFVVTGFAVLHLRIFRVTSAFASALLNLLLLAGIFAVAATSFHSVFLVPLLLLAGIAFAKRMVTFAFRTDFWQETLLLSGVISLLFVLFFWRNETLSLPHADYLFMVRMGTINAQLGLENVGTFYNYIATDYPKAELYHYIEAWLMSFGTFINQQHPALNFFLFSYPLAALVLCIGFRELLAMCFTFTKRKQQFYGVFFLFVGFLLFSHPWDLGTEILDFKKLPISSMGAYWKGLKMMFVMLSLLPILFFLLSKRQEWLLISILAAYIYVPVLPILYVALGGWFLYTRYTQKTIHIPSVLLLLLSGLALIVFYKLQAKGGYMLSAFDPFEWLQPGSWKRYLPAIVMKAAVVPVVCLLPLLLALPFFKKGFLAAYKEPLLFIGLLYLICMGVWAAFVKNINANQSFILLFGSLITLLVFFTIWYLLVQKKWIIGLVLSAVFIIPEAIRAYQFQSPLQQLNPVTVRFLQSAGAARIMYLPHASEMKNIYAYYESIYTGIDEFILYNPHLQLFSTAAAFPADTSRFNSITLATYLHVRNHSPYFRACGALQPDDPCLVEFMRKHNIDYLCTRKQMPPAQWIKVAGGKDSDYYLYKFK